MHFLKVSKFANIYSRPSCKKQVDLGACGGGAAAAMGVRANQLESARTFS